MPTAATVLRALTIRQPWASWVMSGRKPIEYRSRRTNHRGLLLIHAGAAKPSRDDWPYLPPDALVLGAVLGTVRLVDCIEGADGGWEWMLADPCPLAEPIRCPGQLGLWVPPTSILEAVAALPPAAPSVAVPVAPVVPVADSYADCGTAD